MLIACPKCHHQYDVSDLTPGSRFLCHCGDRVRVPKQRVREAVIAHCASCGASLERGKTHCQFCGSDVSAADQLIGEVCPECFRRMLKGAAYCSSCGIRIQAERLLTSPDQTRDCPHCRKAMIKRPVRGGSLLECTQCGGIWLDQMFFEDLVESKDLDSFGEAIRGEGDHPVQAISIKQDVKYLPCPVCQQLMNRKNFAQGSGVILDWCRGHGYWFDALELEQVIQFIRGGGMRRARQREIEEARQAESSRRLFDPTVLDLGTCEALYGNGEALYGNRADQRSNSIDFLDLICSIVSFLFRG